MRAPGKKNKSVCVQMRTRPFCGCLGGMSDDVLESGSKVRFGAMN